MTRASAYTAYFDAHLAAPPERKRRAKATDNILLETGEIQ
jgi:hypothetical protein